MKQRLLPALWVIAWLIGNLAAMPAVAEAAELRAIKGSVTAGDFALKNLQEQRIRFSDYRGQVILLNFWATWCPPCRKEMPAMERLYRTYQDQGFTVVAVSVDTVSPAKIRNFLEELKPAITFPVLHDRDSLVSRRYSVPGTPTSYLIDAHGRIVYRVLGEYDWFSPRAREAVEALLPARERAD